ncbi:unnamed protein product, partial [Mesorhabditis belari]|uniref:Uncharacterized protein n=1 Tax=Mesorhabditis belari TaxID=2138241 RepID=A0AAF3FF55_9BILA
MVSNLTISVDENSLSEWRKKPYEFDADCVRLTFCPNDPPDKRFGFMVEVERAPESLDGLKCVIVFNLSSTEPQAIINPFIFISTYMDAHPTRFCVFNNNDNGLSDSKLIVEIAILCSIEESATCSEADAPVRLNGDFAKMQDPVLNVSSLNKTVLVTSRLIRPDPVYVSDNFDAELRKVSAVSLRRVNTSLDTSRFLLFSTDVTYRIDYAEVPTWITIAFKSTATVALEKFRWDRPTKVCEYQLIVGSPAGIDKHPERKIIVFRDNEPFVRQYLSPNHFSIHVPPGCQPSFALITTHEEEGKSYPYDWNVPQEVCDGQVFVTSYGYENPHMGIVNVVQNTGTEGYNMTRNFYCRKYPVVFDVEVFFVGNGMLTLMILGSKSLGDFNMSVIDDNWPYRVGDAKEVGIFWQQDGAKIKTRGLFVKVNVAKAGAMENRFRKVYKKRVDAKNFAIVFTMINPTQMIFTMINPNNLTQRKNRFSFLEMQFLMKFSEETVIFKRF